MTPPRRSTELGAKDCRERVREEAKKAKIINHLPIGKVEPSILVNCEQGMQRIEPAKEII